MHRLVATLAIAATLLAAGPSPASPPPGERLRIGVVVDGPWERNDEILDIFTREIEELLGREYDVSSAPLQVGDWGVASVERAIDALLDDDEIDVVLGMGPVASHALSSRGPLSKPGIAPFVLDVEVQALPYDRGTSGVHNLNYLKHVADFDTQFRTFHSIFPYRKIAVLNNPAYTELLGELNVKELDALEQELGFERVRVVVPQRADETLAAIPEDVDAVFLTPVLHMPSEEFDRLIAGLIDRRLPSFTVMGAQDVERGILAGLRPKSDWTRKARRVALNIQRILRGEDAGGLPVDFELREQLTINAATARALQTYPPWEVMTEAVLLNEKKRKIERELNVAKVIDEALSASLVLRAQGRATTAGTSEVRAARAALLPQVAVGAAGRLIDEDRAAASFGSAPQRSLDASFDVSQLLWSDQARAGFEIQEHLQVGREAEEWEVELDVINQAVAAYYDVLRAKTFEEIVKDNLRVSRSNFELARIRLTIGAAGPGEVYRWESKIATDRSSVIEAGALRNVAEIQLNTLLDRPGEEPFATTEMDLHDLDYVRRDGRLTPYIDDKWSFSLFREFMVGEAMTHSPELERLDAAIAAQERAALAARRARWSPTVAAFADLDHNLAKGGAGSEGSPLAMQEPDDTAWSLGLSASFDLFQGGAKPAAILQTTEELARLRLQRDDLENRIEQRVRSSVHLAGASWANINLSRAAADAGEKNLDVVMDAYRRGAVSVIDLLDAQNVALVARAGAATAVYDFAQDVNDVERAVGSYRLLRDDEADFYRRLADFMAVARAER